MVLVEAASEAFAERNRALAEARNLSLSSAGNRAGEVDGGTWRARAELILRRDGEVAITLRAKIVVGELASRGDRAIAVGREGDGHAVDVIVQRTRSNVAAVLIDGLACRRRLASGDPERIAIGVDVDGTLAQPALGIRVHPERKCGGLLRVDISDIDPLARDTGIVRVDPAGRNALVTAVPVGLGERRPARIDVAIGALDTEALFVAKSGAEVVVRKSREMGVLVAWIPVVQVVLRQGIERGRIVLEIRNRANLNILGTSVDVHGVPNRGDGAIRGSECIRGECMSQGGRSDSQCSCVSYRKLRREYHHPQSS